MKIINIAPKRAVLVLGVLVASCALAACGSSSSGSSTTTASSGSGTPASSTTGFAARRAKLVTCLKQHGVTLPNRPAGASGGAGGGGGGGFFGGGGGGAGGANPGGTNAGAGGGRGGFFRNNPKDAAAFKACAADFGGGFRPGAGGRFRISHTAITNFVACVRKHGYNLPEPNFSGHGSIFPSNIRTNAKFEAAARSCSSLLRPPGAPGGSTGTSSTPSS